MNYCIFRMEKLKSSSDVCNILKEQHRSEDYESERADPEKSYLNSYSDNFENSFEKFKNLLPKKRRKNAVVALNFLVTTSEEFKSEAEEIMYYTKAVEFIGKNFGEVVGWAIHKDETSTHLQAVTIPLVDGKLNARVLVGGAKNRMREIQNSFYNEVGEPFGLQRGLEGSKAVHQTVEEKIRKSREELRKEIEAFEKEKEAFQKEKADLVASKQALIEEEAAAFEKITAATEKLDPEIHTKNVPTTFSTAVQEFENAVDKKVSQIESVTAEQTLENNRLAYDRQFLDNAAKAAVGMLENAKVTRDTPFETVLGLCRTLAHKVTLLTQEVKKVLDVPLEKVEEFCREARKAGKKTLREFLFPKREIKNQKIETDKNILSKKPDKTFKGRGGRS